MNKDLIPHVRAVLVIGIALTLVAQVVAVPLAASSLAQSFPSVSHLQVPYAVALIAALLGIQVALVAGWLMLGLDGDGAFSSGRVRTGTTVALAGLVVAVLTVSAVLVHAGAVENVGGPMVLFGLIACAGILCAAVPLRTTVRQRLRASS